jgi:AcrR family transcriptional regulator
LVDSDGSTVLTDGQEGSILLVVSEPAYTRLDNDERRRRVLELGAELFTRHAFDEISMAQIAREAGISKALLYHYFPSKQDYFVATLASGAEELRRRVEPDPDLPALEALSASLDAYLAWIGENADAYAKLMQSAATVPDVRDLVEGIRGATVDRILAGIGADQPAARTAVRGWLWFMDGACLDWIAHRDIERPQMLGLLLGTLFGALMAAGVTFPAAPTA